MLIPESATEANLQPVLETLALCTLSADGRLPFKRAIGYVWLDYAAVILDRPPRRKRVHPDVNLPFYEA